MKNCKNLLVRQKHYSRFFYCKYFKREITLNECKNCSNLIFKEIKPIKKVGKKKINVDTKIYNEVLLRDKTCRLKNNKCFGEIQLHHIIYRSEKKSKINDANNCIMLCTYHHQKVHSNKHFWQPKLQEIVKNNYIELY